MRPDQDAAWLWHEGRYPGWQQDYHELRLAAEYVSGAGSVLEIGTAEGGSAYYFGSVMALHGRYVAVDIDEPKCRALRDEAFKCMSQTVTFLSGDSRDPAIIDRVRALGPYDVVFIDGGHDYATVKSDWESYGPLAKRAVIFHDICLPDVRRVWDGIMAPKVAIVERGRFGMGVVLA